MRLLIKIVGWLLAVVLVLVLVVGIGGYVWLRGSLPQTSGSVQVAWIGSTVEIVRDANDIPHIRAASEADALFGLGYVHAQDRLWQMEFQRRIGNGRLSEVLGDSTIETDKFLRRLGPHRAAASAWQQLDPATKPLVEAYTAGINAYISSHTGRQLPVEFTILQFAPEPWRPEDVLVWAKMMAWDLGGSWDDEMLRAQLEAKVGPERAADLMPAYTADGPLILPDGGASAAAASTHAGTTPLALSKLCSGESSPCADLSTVNTTLQQALHLGGEAVGSNNWVIGGARTTTGKPLLANDPHLGSRIPSIWYLAHITGGTLDVIGATIPGLPAVLTGHNARVAWGVTNTGPDVQDLYVQRVDLAAGTIERDGKQVPLERIDEVIKVKGAADITQPVYITTNGPLIYDGSDPEHPEALAFRWTALDPTDTTITAFMALNQASDWQSFTAALQSYRAPMQNFVFADTAGNIGYYAPGSIPIRGQGDGSQFSPGWDSAYDWQGYVPFEQLPHTYNPPQGYIATANNKVLPDNAPVFLGSAFAAPYRAQRIVELIEATPQLSPDDMVTIQADMRSALARAVLPSLLSANTQDSRAQQAIGLMRDWDGTLAANSAQAAIFEGWYNALTKRVFADEVGSDIWEDYGTNRNFIAMRLVQQLQDNGPWCDDVSTPATEDCATTSGAALVDGLAAMAQEQGSEDIIVWRWGKAHEVVFPHQPFDNVSTLKRIFSRQIAAGGDGFTVNVAGVDMDDSYNAHHIASYRHIIDLGNLEASRFIQPVGQSGQLLSGSYSNLIERWERVEYLPMQMQPQGTTTTLRLEPG